MLPWANIRKFLLFNRMCSVSFFFFSSSYESDEDEDDVHTSIISRSANTKNVNELSESSEINMKNSTEIRLPSWEDRLIYDK